jgi:hypothetical protein
MVEPGPAFLRGCGRLPAGELNFLGRVNDGFHPFIGITLHDGAIFLDEEDDFAPFQAIFPSPELGVAQENEFIFLSIVDGFIPGGDAIALNHANLALGFNPSNFFDTHGT